MMRPPEIRLHNRYGGIDLKRAVGVSTTHYISDTDVYWKTDWEEVLVGLNKGRLRLRYPNARRSPVQYLDDASDDLKALSALFICHLLPGGILADKLEEDTKHKQAADIIRRWEEIKSKEVPN